MTTKPPAHAKPAYKPTGAGTRIYLPAYMTKTP